MLGAGTRDSTETHLCPSGRHSKPLLPPQPIKGAGTSDTADKELGLRCGFAKLGVSLQLDSGMTVTGEGFRQQEAMTWRPECPDGTPRGTSGGQPPSAVPQSPVWRAGEADGRRGALAVSGLACWLPWLTQPPSLTRRGVCRRSSYDTVTEPFLFLSVS